MLSLDELEIKNLQIHHDELVAATSILAGTLFEQNKQRDLNIEELEKQSVRIKDFDCRIEELSTIHTNQSKDIATLRKNNTDEKALAVKELDRVKKEIREAVKELGRINQQVIAANTELEKLEPLRASITVAETISNQLQKDIEFYTVRVNLLIEEQNRHLTEISTNELAWQGTLKTARDELSTLVHLAEQKKLEAQQAQARVKTYTDELYTHMNDYQIVKARLETVWGKTFPELELSI